VVGLFWTPLWASSVFALAFFAASLTFHYGGAIYHLELYPWPRALRRGRRGDGGARGAAPAAAARDDRCSLLALPALWTAVGIAGELRLVLGHAPERGWVYARLGARLRVAAPAPRAGVHPVPPSWDGNADLTYNEPDLEKADLVRAIDKGARNAELLPHFSGPPGVRLDPITLRAEQSADEPQLDDGAADAAPVPRRDAPAEPLHGRVTERKAEPAALPRRGGGEERFEQPRKHFRGNALAIVLHLHLHPHSAIRDPGRHAHARRPARRH